MCLQISKISLGMNKVSIYLNITVVTDNEKAKGMRSSQFVRDCTI